MIKGLKTFFHNLFVPHEKNNYRARALHHDFLTTYLVLALVFVFGVKYFGVHGGNVLGFATDISTQKLFELTNVERQKDHLSSLTYNDKLAQAAKAKANDMFAKDYWAHYAPDGKSPWNFMYDVGYQYEYAGENLAKNFLISKDVVDAWMNSPSHRENMLKPEYTEVGYAIKNGVLNGEETTLVVQMFGKPMKKTGVEVEAATLPSSPQEENVPAVQGSQKVTIPVQAPLNLFMVFVVFLMVLLTTDLYFALKLNLLRFHGKNLAHLIFLGFIMLGFIFFLSKGGII